MKIDNQTLAILSRVTVEENRILLTCGQLDRKQYVAVNKILEAIGGKWNRKAQAHVFDSDPNERLESVLLTGSVTPPERYGFFPTPPEIARKLVDTAGIGPYHSVLEPSAGHGAILDCLPKCAIECVEFLPDNAKVLADKGYDPLVCDFLMIEPNGTRYDRVVANPPFSYPGHPQADIDHINHMMKFLAPGGRLVSVASAGVMFRENRKTIEFREMVLRQGFFEPLPEDAFKASGTKVRTVIVVINNGP